jgi:transglutaminase-like putative cysteine protease/uncharacterized protein YggU (UPF0235/DUF167 family)
MHIIQSVTFSLLLILAIPQGIWAAIPSIEDAPVASEYWAQTQYFPDGAYISTRELKKTILTPEGISDVSSMQINYDQSHRVKVIKAVVKQPGSKEEIILGTKQIDVRLEATSSNGLSNNKQVKFLFPKLKVGSTVTVIYEHQSIKNLDCWGKQGIQAYFLPKNERVDRLYEEFTTDRPWVWESRNMEDFSIQTSENKKQLTVTLKKPRYYWFINALNICFVRNHGQLVLHTTKDTQTTFNTEIKVWNKLLKKPLPKPMAAIVKQVTNQAPEQRVIEILRYIRNNYRYLGDWRRVKWGFVPFALPEIAKHGYGDCKDLSLMLVAMLRASGIDAEPAHVQRGIEADKVLLPSVIYPNHTLVRAKVGEKIWWLDPTNSVFLPDYIPSDIHDRWVVIFRADNRVELSHIPHQSSDMIALQTNRVYERDQEGNWQILSRVNYSGAKAISVATLDYHQNKEITNQLICNNDKKHCHVKRQGTDFLISSPYPMEITQYLKEQNKFYGNATIAITAGQELASLFPILKHYLDNQGNNDLYLGNFYSSHLHNIYKNYQVSKPVSQRITSPWLDYELKWYNSPQEKGCVFEAQFIRKVDWLDHNTLTSPAFKVFFKKLEGMKKDMEQIVNILDPHALLEPKKES